MLIDCILTRPLMMVGVVLPLLHAFKLPSPIHTSTDYQPQSKTLSPSVLDEFFPPSELPLGIRSNSPNYDYYDSSYEYDSDYIYPTESEELEEESGFDENGNDDLEEAESWDDMKVILLIGRPKKKKPTINKITKISRIYKQTKTNPITRRLDYISTESPMNLHTRAGPPYHDTIFPNGSIMGFKIPPPASMSILTEMEEEEEEEKEGEMEKEMNERGRERERQTLRERRKEKERERLRKIQMERERESIRERERKDERERLREIKREREREEEREMLREIERERLRKIKREREIENIRAKERERRREIERMRENKRRKEIENAREMEMIKRERGFIPSFQYNPSSNQLPEGRSFKRYVEPPTPRQFMTAPQGKTYFWKESRSIYRNRNTRNQKFSRKPAYTFNIEDAVVKNFSLPREHFPTHPYNNKRQSKHASQISRKSDDVESDFQIFASIGYPNHSIRNFKID